MPRPPSHDPAGDTRFWGPYRAIAGAYSGRFRLRTTIGREAAVFDLPRVSGVAGVPDGEMVHLLTRSLVALDVRGVGEEVRWLGPRLRAALPMDMWPDLIPGGVRIACRVPGLDVRKSFSDQAAEVRHAMSCLWRLREWWWTNQGNWAAWRTREAFVFEVRHIAGRETWGLRRAVLRPHQQVEEMHFPGDDDPETVHFGGYVEGQLRGIVSIYRAPMPGADKAPEYVVPEAGQGPDAWQFRGMATDMAVRGSGLGAKLLVACIEHAAKQGGRLLWCNARVTAAPFYRKYGMSVVSGVFTPPGIGPHVVMVREVTSEQQPVTSDQ